MNGKVIRTPDHWVDVKRDRVLLHGKPLRALEKIYLLLYKPKGYITSYKDPQGRPTVYDLIKDVGQWAGPVGRLDQDTSGLLILTNANDFADYLTDPANHVPKTYLVKTSPKLEDESLERLRRGIELNDGMTRPATVERIRDSASATFLEITITEGRNRQVRRMIEAVGSRVRKLVRTRIGSVQIDDLQIGKWRHLTAAEVSALSRTGGKTR